MWNNRLFFLGVTIGVGLIVTETLAWPWPQSQQTVQSTESNNPPIPLAELRERGVEGRLGVPLGKIVEVTGVVVENRSRAKADAAEPFFLRVESVDGKSLKTPQLYSSSAMPLAREVDGLKVGDRFRCVGYETGGYEGSPPGEFDYVPSYTTIGYSFVACFVILKPITPKGKTL